jgi:hemerythrin-like metal-binding protein
MNDKLAAWGDAGLLAEALDAAGLGIIILDDALRVVFVDEAYRRMFGFEAEHCRPGASFVDIMRRLAERGEFGDGPVEASITERLLPIRMRRPVRLTRVRPGGTSLTACGTPLNGGGYVYTVSDATPEHKAAERLNAANRAAVLAMADLAEFRDTDTGDHVVRVARLSYEITRQLHSEGAFPGVVTADFCEHMAVASMLHDVGKVAIPDDILHKPGKLDADERAKMETHSPVGGRILDKALVLAPDSLYLSLGAAIARHHHERYDGAGYPDGLAGEAIPLAARIVTVADVFDALTSERPYKRAWPEAEAFAYLTDQAGKQFDPAVVAAALAVIEERRQTTIVRWTQDMSVGDPSLDHDHGILIGLINQMALPRNRSDRAVQEFVLDELLGYTAAHFSREEEHMRQIGYGERDQHAEIHRQLIAKLGAIRAHFLAGDSKVGEEVATFLAEWLTDHILRADHAYARLAPAG